MDAPADAIQRRAVPPVRVYAADALPPAILPAQGDRAAAALTQRIVVPPRDARCIHVPRGAILRLALEEGAQVGDLNLWAADDLSERLFTGKTRALHGTHVSTGDRLWSNLPHMRPLATITADSLGWYGRDGDGCGVHDVIGTRCDPYTNAVLGGADYDRCCHSNLTRALAAHLGVAVEEAEPHIHDVLNVFMCTGYDADGRYIMKASPARTGDFLELRAEVDLLAALSACPGGDCAAGHSSDAAQCHPIVMEVWTLPGEAAPEPAKAPYRGHHGV